MKKFLLLVAFCVCAVAGVSAQDIEARNIIEKHVAGEGYKPTIDSDGDIKFKAEGETYYVKVEDRDSYDCLYISLLHGFYTDDVSADHIAYVCNYINSTYKMATCYYEVDDDGRVDIWIECSSFVKTADDFLKVFDRILNNIIFIEGKFTSEMFD